MMFADAEADYTIEAGNFQYEVIATWTGKHRELRASTLGLIERWVKALRKSPDVAKLFEHEVELSAGGVSYWLPIQNSLVEPFVREVQPQARLKLFIMYIGALKSDKLFIINEFRSMAQPAMKLDE